jgi:hypothetical protein
MGVMFVLWSLEDFVLFGFLGDFAPSLDFF